MIGYCAAISSPCSSLYSAKRLRRPAQAMGLGERFEMATHVVTLRAVQVDVMVKVTVFSKGFPMEDEPPDKNRAFGCDKKSNGPWLLTLASRLEKSHMIAYDFSYDFSYDFRHEIT
jgi:hypothetical protein